jgi:hypothetical protein
LLSHARTPARTPARMHARTHARILAVAAAAGGLSLPLLLRRRRRCRFVVCCLRPGRVALVRCVSRRLRVCKQILAKMHDDGSMRQGLKELLNAASARFTAKDQEPFLKAAAFHKSFVNRWVRLSTQMCSSSCVCVCACVRVRVCVPACILLLRLLLAAVAVLCVSVNALLATTTTTTTATTTTTTTTTIDTTTTTATTTTTTTTTTTITTTATTTVDSGTVKPASTTRARLCVCRVCVAVFPPSTCPLSFASSTPAHFLAPRRFLIFECVPVLFAGLLGCSSFLPSYRTFDPANFNEHAMEVRNELQQQALTFHQGAVGA